MYWQELRPEIILQQRSSIINLMAISIKRTYIDKALEMSAENHFFLRQRSLILARQGDKKGAIETAKLSIIAAEAAGNTDYVKMNKDSISEWSK
jgi:regulator of sirC expression with transglutaminase-like and TPR domain